MPVKSPDDLLKYIPPLGKGVISHFAPDIVRGFIIKVFKERKVDVVVATKWVREDKSLWQAIGPEYRGRVKHIIKSNISSTSWFTSEWAINSLKGELPVLASLFLGWDEARLWLDRQVEEIKRELA